ncbi:MAG: hypothetical protein V9H69_19300 [Anaerolineae bacterium]
MADAAEQTLLALLAGESKAQQDARPAVERCPLRPMLCGRWPSYNAVAKLGFTDHGPIHAHMAAAAAVQLLQLLAQAGYTP